MYTYSEKDAKHQSTIPDSILRSNDAEQTPTTSHIPVAIQRSVSPTSSISPTPSGTSSVASGLTTPPGSRIPIRSMNAEKRARLSGEYVPEIDETKLSPSEIRALK